MTGVILTNGDSWTFGSEIVAPEFYSDCIKKTYKQGFADIHPINDYYRIPRIWPYTLSKNLNKELINISWPARSNDSIYDSTISWILKNYTVPGKSTTDLTVVIGWTTPERKNVIFTEDDDIYTQTIWPNMMDNSYYRSDTVREYFRMHVNYLWTEYEYITRFVNHNYDLSNFCKLHNIKLYTFNSFYETPKIGIYNWQSCVNICNILDRWDHTKLTGWTDNFFNWKEQIYALKAKWNSISSDQFILKDIGSFKGYIDNNIPQEIRFEKIHPSAESHIAWGTFLSTWINERNNKE